MSKPQTFAPKFRDAWVFLYSFFYISVFYYVEHRPVAEYIIISSKLDNFIPFSEYFIIPYLLWFPYMFISLVFFYFMERESYNKYVIMGVIGMTAFLFISVVFPNALIIRPRSFERNNIFTTLVTYLHQFDTSTNVFPSIHVFNSLVVHVTVLKSQVLQGKTWVHISSWILCGSIILSTVFLKQHSVIDVLGAFGLYVMFYPLVYGWVKSRKRELLTNH